DGADGADGATILTGPGVPDDDLGEDGDLYIDTETRLGCQEADGSWTMVTNLNSGSPGTSTHAGSGAPEASLGNDGDVYVDADSGDLYKKDDGAWTLIGNLRGPQGEPGQDGNDGADGTDGASILTGEGAPADDLGKDDDLYIDSANGDLYAKADGTWTLSGNLHGAPGQDGSRWLTGTGVPTDDLGNDGDVYFDGDTGNAYLKEDGAWTLLGRFADHQVAGKDWFAFALDDEFSELDAVGSFVTGADQVHGAFEFTGPAQHGRLAFKTVGGYFGVGSNLSAFSEIEVSASTDGESGRDSCR